MYFDNRIAAGELIAQKVTHQNTQVQTVIIALNEGGVIVALPIAEALRAPILLLETEEVPLPGINMPTIGTMDESGGFTYNSNLSSGEVSDYVAEYHGIIEADKLEKMHKINAMITAQGGIDRTFLHEKRVILVTDGLATPGLIDAAIAYLKPVKTARIIAAVPVASVPAIDRLHIVTDEIHVLSVVPNYLSTDHYYEENALPSHEKIQEILNQFHKYVTF